MKIVLKILLHILVAAFLTVISQIGGIIYLGVILICNRRKEKYRLRRFALFKGIYLLATIWGRERIKKTDYIKAHSIYTLLPNRKYVKPKINTAHEKISLRLNKMQNGVKLVYLDANFS